MSEFEDGIRDALRDGGPADESFVQRVDSRIEMQEQRRMIGLALAAGAAMALITLMAVGIGLIAPALVALLGQGVPAPSPQALSILGVAAPAAGLLLLAALAFPFVRPRK
jgi:hypothetical protein